MQESAQNTPLGSSAWLESIFASAPVRDPRGRSRPTQRHSVREPGLTSHTVVAEGGNTAIAQHLMTLLQNAGQVRRFKLEPFQLRPMVDGVDAVPDMLVELKNGELIVIENKSARFLTAQVLQHCREVEAIISEARMRYALWTDVWPLGRTTHRLMRTLRRCGHSAASPEQICELHRQIKNRVVTLGELRKYGVFIDAVLHEVWHGRATCHLTEELSDSLEIGTDIRLLNYEPMLTAPVCAHDWWFNLPRA
ncbi:hypothetical protein HMPREF9701_04024 [Delftia acidovorans CCUG 274B]|nr:hypothetical protein HMPREF9701_04024 [Delftia acidovorans CCUG 274B]